MPSPKSVAHYIFFTLSDAEIQGCLWHLCRAFVKKAKQLHIFRYCKLYPTILDYIRKACAVALLPNNLFEDGVRVVKDSARAHNIVIAWLLDPFMDYILEKWINNPVRNQWMNLYRARHRTNNSCETHNRMLKNKVGAYRPNVYMFIQALGTLENNAFLDSQLEISGEPARNSRRERSIFADRQMLNLSRDLEEDIFHDLDESIKHFINRAADLFYGAFNDHVNEIVGQV